MVLTATGRRLNEQVERIGASVNDPSPETCPDAVAYALGDLSDLWETWSSARDLRKFPQQERAVEGIAEGETVAALVFARGAKSHEHVEFGDLTDSFSDHFYDHFGVWRWGPCSDLRPSFLVRSDWYVLHVAGQETLPPFERALVWLRAQPELAP